MRTFFLNAILLILTSNLCLSQAPDSSDSYVPVSGKKNYLRPAAEVICLNVGIWSIDRYVAKQEWARISWETMKHNLKSGFHWDDSGFGMNQILHPLHGNLFFNIARTNGLNFWESAPYAFGGSLMWELFMEVEEPSINDLVTTTLGGIMLGETTHRISLLILDDRTTGSDRTWREIGAFVVNPIGGLNRVITGRTKMVSSTLQYSKPNVLGSISVGNNRVSEGNNLLTGSSKIMFKLGFVYGDPFDIDSNWKPFDYMRFKIAVSPTDPKLINEFYGNALIYGKNFTLGNSQENVIGIFQHYDYMNKDIYEIGASAIGGGLISRLASSDKMQCISTIHVSAIPMGGSNSEYAEIVERDYNLGVGASGKGELALIHKTYGGAYLDYMVHWIHTLSGADGDEIIQIVKYRMNVPIYQKLGIGLDYLTYWRRGYYDEFPDIEKRASEVRAFLSILL